MDSLINRLTGREVLIVGDSINSQLFWALRNFLLQPPNGSTHTQMTEFRAPVAGVRCKENMTRPGYCERWSQHLDVVNFLPFCLRVECEGGFNVTYVRNDFLQINDEFNVNLGFPIVVPWMEAINGSSDGSTSDSSSGSKRSNIAAVVLNRGAHYKEDSELLSEVRGLCALGDTEPYDPGRRGGAVG